METRKKEIDFGRQRKEESMYQICKEEVVRIYTIYIVIKHTKIKIGVEEVTGKEKSRKWLREIRRIKRKRAKKGERTREKERKGEIERERERKRVRVYVTNGDKKLNCKSSLLVVRLTKDRKSVV